MRGGPAGLDKLNDESGFSRLNNGSTTISEVKTAVEYCSRPPAIFRNGYTETIVNKSRQLPATSNPSLGSPSDHFEGPIEP